MVAQALPTEPQTSITEPILAIDDDAALRELVRTGLTACGYRVDTAASIAEARALLRTRAYALVLSDYEMPGGTGLELLEYVCRVYPGLPFILLTGHDEVDLARYAIRSGAVDFLGKPFELRQLVRQIEQNWARVERDRARAAELTNEVLQGTIRALVAAVDAKDPFTAQHSERVSRLAVALGRAIGLPDDRLRVLEFSALLHDVGKIGIPGRILLKPGKLTEEEWAVIKTHPERSAEIVSEVGALAEVATIVRHHHERMDGEGYPDGLEGDAIPLLSRIITTADAYEALTADRAYRPAMLADDAARLLRSYAGSQFDPWLVEAFLSLDLEAESRQR
jgi:putative two-component system response regulator